VVHEFIALAHRHAFGADSRHTGRCSGLKPRLAAVVGALNDLSEPAAALRGVEAIRIRGGALEVVKLPAGEVRPAHVPFFTFSIGSQNKSALTGANEYAYIAHFRILL